jgi:hypothetical protein
VYLVAAVRVGDVLCVRHELGEFLLCILPTPAANLLRPFLLRDRAPEKFSELATYFVALSDEVAENDESVFDPLMRSYVEFTSYAGERVSNIEVRHVQECARRDKVSDDAQSSLFGVIVKRRLRGASINLDGAALLLVHQRCEHSSCCAVMWKTNEPIYAIIVVRTPFCVLTIHSCYLRNFHKMTSAAMISHQ